MMESVEKREPSYIVGGNVNWCDHYGKWYGESQKPKNTILSSNPNPGHPSRENHDSRRYMYPNVHHSPLYNSFLKWGKDFWDFYVATVEELWQSLASKGARTFSLQPGGSTFLERPKVKFPFPLPHSGQWKQCQTHTHTHTHTQNALE